MSVAFGVTFTVEQHGRCKLLGSDDEDAYLSIE